MQTIDLEDFEEELPTSMPISVIMEKRPSQSQWVDYSFQAIGVVSEDGFEEQKVRTIFKDGDIEHLKVSGLSITLHADECESYYHNMMSPQPGCFIVANNPEDADDMPIPYIVSLSFDEVHAYLEGDEQIYSVEIPPELYKWTEAFVLTHYVAVKKTKRKLKNWKESSTGDIRKHYAH